MIYLVFFILSCLYLYQQRNNHKKVVCGGVLCQDQTTSRSALIFVVLVFSILAGLRDPKVGTDTDLYPLPAFEYAIGENDYFYYLEFLVLQISMSEVGYATLAYLCAHISTDFNTFLFICALIINSGYMFFLNYHSKKYNFPIWLPWLFFCCFMYPQTLNLAKQSLALSFCLIAYVFWDQGHFKRAIALVAVAMTFHPSSIAVSLYAFERIIKRKVIRKGLLGFVAIILLGNYSILAYLMSFSPQLFGRFYVYLEREDGDIALFSLLYNVLLLVVLWVLCRPKKNKRLIPIFNSAVYLYLIEILFLCFSAMSSQAGRISFYFLPIVFVYVPLFFRISPYRKYEPLLALSLLCYWAIIVVYQGATETYPFKFYFES